MGVFSVMSSKVLRSVLGFGLGPMSPHIQTKTKAPLGFVVWFLGVMFITHFYKTDFINTF